MPRWSVDLISSRTRFAFRLGTVEAANAKEAIEIAIRQYRIPPISRDRLVVNRIGECDDD